MLKLNNLFRGSSVITPRPTRRAATTVLAIAAMSYGLLHSFHAQAKPSDELVPGTETSKEAVATLAGGCFWCTEAVFERMEGVNDVVSGYIGGTAADANYERVCSKKTGHAEAVEIYYDPAKVKFEELLEVFFKTHDPVTLNKQGADEGPQYRSSIFYHDAEQKRIAEAYIAQLDASGKLPGPIVTKLEEASKFYPAEEYHQDYFRRNPNAGYCQAVVRSKVEKFDAEFADKRKTQ